MITSFIFQSFVRRKLNAWHFLLRKHLVISNNSEQNYTVHQCLSVLHETFERWLVSPKGCPHSKSSYFMLVFKNSYDQKWFILENLLCYSTSINSWWFDICLYENWICYTEKARSCYWMTVTNQLLHGPPRHLCAHLVALCHIVPSLMCWHESQVAMCQNSFDIQGSQFSTFVDSFSLIGISKIM